MDNDKQLLDLRRRSEELQKEFSDKPATKAEICVLATIMSDLIDIVHAHIYRNDDPGVP